MASENSVQYFHGKVSKHTDVDELFKLLHYCAASTVYVDKNFQLLADLQKALVTGGPCI